MGAMIPSAPMPSPGTRPSEAPPAEAVSAGPAPVVHPESSETLSEARPPAWAPVVEILAYVALVLVADRVWGQGNRFADIEPHPFWAIVLLMAVHYGTREALMATAAASVALLAWHLPPQGFEQSIHDYAIEVLLRPLLWMVTALVLGELRVRHQQIHEVALGHLANARRRLELLSRAYGEMTVAKERLETRLAGQLRTATGMFQAARALETLDPGRVLAGAADLMAVALNARAFSIYLLQGDTLVLAAAQGWAAGASRAERFGPGTPLFQAVVGGQRVVSVSTEVGEAALAGEGLMAGPLIDPSSGRLLGMLKVEDLAFLDFNLSSLQTFTAMTEWIAASYANACTHAASQIEDTATHLYGMTFLDRQAAYMTEVALRFGFDLTLLFFRVNTDDLPADERQAIPAALGEVSRRVLRRTDLAFNHEPPGTQFAVLLPGATADGVVVVARKLVEGLSEARGYPVPCTTQVRVLSRADQLPSRTDQRGTPAEADLVA